VILAEQRIFLERPGFSQKTDTTTVNGRTHQLAGWNTSEWGFTLGDNVRQRIGEGWNWFYLWDYYPGGHNGEPDLDPPTGADKFKIYIALHPHVSGRVIVYDR
jgi:hypothetical protein